MDIKTKINILHHHIRLKNESLAVLKKLLADGDLSEDEYEKLERDILQDFFEKKQSLISAGCESLGHSQQEHEQKIKENFDSYQRGKELKSNVNAFQEGNASYSSDSNAQIRITNNQSGSIDMSRGLFSPTMYDLPLFKCTFPDCQQYATHSSSLNMNFSTKFCTRHMQGSQIELFKIYNHCSFFGCRDYALYRYGEPSVSFELLCALHRKKGMVSIYPMCTDSGCNLTATHRFFGDSIARFCSKHSMSGMERMCHTVGENIGRLSASSDLSIQQCQPCEPSPSSDTSSLNQQQQQQDQQLQDQQQQQQQQQQSDLNFSNPSNIYPFIPKEGVLYYSSPGSFLFPPAPQRSIEKPRLSLSPASSTVCDVSGCAVTQTTLSFVGKKIRRYCHVHKEMQRKGNFKLPLKRGRKPDSRKAEILESWKCEVERLRQFEFDLTSSNRLLRRLRPTNYCAFHRGPGMNTLSQRKCMVSSCCIRPTFM